MKVRTGPTLVTHLCVKPMNQLFCCSFSQLIILLKALLLNENKNLIAISFLKQYSNNTCNLKSETKDENPDAHRIPRSIRILPERSALSYTCFSYIRNRTD